MSIIEEQAFIKRYPGHNHYQLLDSGYGQKCEKLGDYIFIRPESTAMWPKGNENLWHNPHAIFEAGSTNGAGKWKLLQDVPDFWNIMHHHLPIKVRLTPFRHYGFFPEQQVFWPVIEEFVKDAHIPKSEMKCLNLFAYSGTASIMMASLGMQVTHIDSSPKAIGYLKDNMQHYDATLPIKSITEDVMKYVQREVRRKNEYDIIILDPPKYGRGPKGEVWDVHKDLPTLLHLISELTKNKKKLLIIITAYAIRSGALPLANALDISLKRTKGRIKYGDIAITEKCRNMNITQAIYASYQTC